MKKTTLAFLMTFFTASTLFSGVTQAEGRPGEQWHHQGEHGDADGPGRGHDSRGDDRRGHGPDRYQPRDRFAWQGRDFRRGEPVPPRFRGDEYRVSDWHERGLREPPHGEHWAWIDGNYVLIAATTGIITSILLNNAFH